MSGKPSAVYANRLARYRDAVWLIWSNKWGCWYRDNHQGYTSDIAQAGLYNRDEAALHYVDGPKRLRHVEPFPISSVRAMLHRRRGDIEREAAQQIARIDAALSGRLAGADQQDTHP